MCGIAGIISKNEIFKGAVERMSDAIVHRGPDGYGYYYGDGFAFGHRRLSIVDLSEAGRQPMEYMDRYVITYNGEVYNFPELRTELENEGYKFKSHTDTEVIMAAYDKWGVECLLKFNGMWAFVLYDKQKDEFFISRDRFGVKPLYYYQDENSFIFASEIKALLANSTVKTAPNLNYLKRYMREGALEYIKETAFENIYRFDFDSYIILNKNNFTEQIKEIKFWDFEVNTSNEAFDEQRAQEIAKKYYELLKDAVRIRLRADVDVGTALSGGLDSSSVAYLIDKILKEKGVKNAQQTFSTVFSAKEAKYCDESYFINLLTKTLNIKSNQIEPKPAEVPKFHKKGIFGHECPCDGITMGGTYTLYLVSQSNIKVILEGQGADEQQAGYSQYVINYLSNLKPSELWREYKAITEIQGVKKHFKIALAVAILKNIFGRRMTLFLARLLKKTDKTSLLLPLNEELKKSCFRGLINLIHYGDSRSMRVSVENRMPFLDYRLVEFMAKIPSCYKIHNGWTKYFARLAFNEKLPDEITWRRDKKGWPIPTEAWFKGDLKKYYKDTIKNSKFLKSLPFSHEYDAKKMYISERLLNIAVWYECFFEKNK